MHRILIIRAGALGDTILLFPALAALRHRFPAARIEAIGYPPTLALAVHTGLVDRVRSIDDASLAHLFSGAGDIDRHEELSSYASAFDLIVAYCHDPEKELRRTLCGLAPGARVLVAEPFPPDGVHAADWCLTPLRSVGVEASTGPFRIDVPEAKRKEARSYLAAMGCHSPLVAVHPGSGGKRKCWPASRFAQTIDLLADLGFRSVLISGPADGEASQAVAGLVKEEKVLSVLDDLSLPRLSAVLSVCDAYVGNDSGVTHLAAQVGCPTIAVFGPTDPAMWGPRGSSVTILHDKEGWVEVYPVVSSIVANLKQEDT